MGKAIIVQNIGAGLYKIRPLWYMEFLERELNALNSIESTYLTTIANALNTRDLLQNDVVLATDALNAVIKQWKDNLIRRGQENPPPLEPENPIDPNTGLPWEDPDRAQEDPLLTEINNARTAASVSTVTRDTQLDAACLSHLRYQKGNGKTGHFGDIGSKARDRARWAGYFNPTTLYEILAYGPRSPSEACVRFLKTNNSEILSSSVTKIGIAHVYAEQHFCSYLWAVIVASDEAAEDYAVVSNDPAKKAAEEVNQSLDGIQKTELDQEKPQKLENAVKTFALAKQKYLAAQRELERLMTEKLIRIQRISELETLKSSLENMEAIDCWCCTYTYDLPVGATVNTMEVPGWYYSQGTVKMSTLYEGTPSELNVLWTERSINIAARATGSAPDYGMLTPSASMTSAAVAANYALEPGHLKWNPFWRYGIITEKSGDRCSVSLNAVNARLLAGEKRRSGGYGSSELSLNNTETLTNVPIVYPPCNGNIFEVGDEIVIEFASFDLTKYSVVGFRREPRACPPSRISWEQI